MEQENLPILDFLKKCFLLTKLQENLKQSDIDEVTKPKYDFLIKQLELYGIDYNILDPYDPVYGVAKKGEIDYIGDKYLLDKNDHQ